MNLDRMYTFLRGNLRALGAFAVATCVLTWAIDLSGLVHKCPYCQVQRSAIGIAGVLMMLPDPRYWLLRMSVAVVCFLGAHVAAAQIFLVYRNMTSGQPSNPLNLVLAASALVILVGQALLVLSDDPHELDKR